MLPAYHKPNRRVPRRGTAGTLFEAAPEAAIALRARGRPGVGNLAAGGHFTVQTPHLE